MMTTDKEKKAIKFLEDNDIFPYDFGDEMAPDNEDFYQEEDVYKALALARQDERKKIRARVEPSIQELFSCSVCGKEDDTGGFEKPRRFCPYCLSLEIEKGKLQGEKDEREKCDKEVAGMTCACDDDANQICGFHRNKEKEQFEKGEQAGREEVSERKLTCCCTLDTKTSEYHVCEFHKALAEQMKQAGREEKEKERQQDIREIKRFEDGAYIEKALPLNKENLIRITEDDEQTIRRLDNKIASLKAEVKELREALVKVLDSGCLCEYCREIAKSALAKRETKKEKR
jgi:hypothetical protein